MIKANFKRKLISLILSFVIIIVIICLGGIIFVLSFFDAGFLFRNQKILLITGSSLLLLSMLLGFFFWKLLLIMLIKRIRVIYHQLGLTEQNRYMFDEELKSTMTQQKWDEWQILTFLTHWVVKRLAEKNKAEEQLLLGKEIQEKFITSTPFQNDFIDIYGFYEGAKGVSGDYFDYKRLDEEHYAFILSDVAGKAIPAALIMVQISTIFHGFCSNFEPGKSEIETLSLVQEINDQLVQRNFLGRFVSILALILNVKTGKLYVTNAGYHQLLIYRNKNHRCEWEQLDDRCSAAGIFNSSMLPIPYHQQEQICLDHGDILFLFSDGFEESRNGHFLIKEGGIQEYETLGMENIIKTFNETAEKTPKVMVTELVRRERDFRGKEEQYDDLSLLAVMRK